jgi:hypothetical protein
VLFYSFYIRNLADVPQDGVGILFYVLLGQLDAVLLIQLLELAQTGVKRLGRLKGVTLHGDTWQILGVKERKKYFDDTKRKN